MAGPDPTALFVYDFGYRACAVPTVVSRYWVQTTMSGHSITSLDGGDPSHPGEVGHIVLQGDALPHWIGHEPGGNRLVIPGFGWLTTHVLFASIDLRTGALMLEPQDIVFDRQWPDGWSGPAMPNGAVFSNEPGAMRDK